MTKCPFSPPRPSTGYIGHRGLAAFAPENTMASFKLAAKQGFDWIEFDLWLSKDNQLVIFHDQSLNRTTNGEGQIYDQTSDYLVNLDAGSWFHPSFEQERIPLFVEDLPQLLSLNVFMNIELKLPENPTEYDSGKLADKISKTLENHWPTDRSLPLISSFYWPVLHQVRAHLPDIPLGFLTEHCSEDMINTIALTPNAALHTHYANFTADLLARTKAFALPVLLYTVNDPKAATQLLNQGVFGIFSDNGGLDHSMLR